jgi:hypothetical protein
MKTDAITRLRRNIFRLIDETLETGEPTLLNRKGKKAALVTSCRQAEVDWACNDPLTVHAYANFST